MRSKSIFSLPSIWMINNPIASTILMLSVFLFGYFSFERIVQETSPSFKTNEILIEIEYPGATPKDIEQGIILSIEHQLKDNINIDTISATASEGTAEIYLELIEGVDPNTVLSEVSNSVDSINSFPQQMEQPNIKIVEEKDSIVELGLHGALTELEIYKAANKLKQALLLETDVSGVDINGIRSPEIMIEIEQSKLLQYQLTLEQVLAIVQQSVIDVPTGSIETNGGSISIRTVGRKEAIAEFASIELLKEHDGKQVFLSDLASIGYGFQGASKPFFVNGEPGVEVVLYQSKESKPIELSESLTDFVDEYRSTLPAGLSLTILQDQSDAYIDRISLLTSNGVIGMILVMLVLSLFLDLRLAFWVGMGIPIAIIGAIGFMPLLDIPLNMVTLFAFIITLGILVDDAVIVSESIFNHVQQGLPINTALKEGVKEMALPVVFSVFTNIIAFVPLFFVPGELGTMYKPMTLLIFAIFFVSLVEALLILPLHLKGITKPLQNRFIVRIQSRSFQWFNVFKTKVYKKWLLFSCKNPAFVVVSFISFSILIFSWVYSGRVDSSFVPKIESTRIDAEIEFLAGSTLQANLAVLNHVEKAGIAAINQLSAKGGVKYHMQEVEPGSGSSTFMIVPEDQRNFTAKQFVDVWRENIGDVPGVKSVFFDYQVGPGGGKELVIELAHSDNDVLTNATKALMDELQRIKGVTDIDSQLVDGQLQYNVAPNVLGQQLGFTNENLGSQIRLHFYGGEALRYIVDGNEVKVRVMMSKSEHYYAGQLGDLLITAPNGDIVKLAQVAEITKDKTVTSIERVDAARTVEITGSFLREVASASIALSSIEEIVIPKLEDKYPEIDIELGGEARIESKVNTEIVKGAALSLAIIFAFLAITLRNYFDAILVMLVIPFCIVAGMFGHILMGFPFSVMSLFGMIALSGLVINGAFVLLLRYKSNLAAGQRFHQAIIEASLYRFRPVVLTAVTTAAGLLPMLFETSTQALYLIPMAISLSFGSLYSVFTILILLPAALTLVERFRQSDNAPTMTKHQCYKEDWLEVL